MIKGACVLDSSTEKVVGVTPLAACQSQRCKYISALKRAFMKAVTAMGTRGNSSKRIVIICYTLKLYWTFIPHAGDDSLFIKGIPAWRTW